MKTIDTASYGEIMKYLENKTCGKVFPKSVVLMNRHGDIYKEGDAVLIWHCCGFAYICGRPDEKFLEKIYGEFLSAGNSLPRRFVLFTADAETERFFRGKEGLAFGKRNFFEYPTARPDLDFTIPEGYSVREMDEELFEAVQGRVTPRTFWKDAKEFCDNGKGYCVMCDGRPAAWAFSAAVSDDELDIGIETSEEHRHRGLAKAVAGKMIGYCFEHNKRPTWACDASNAASHDLAVKLGFIKTSECVTIRSDKL